MSGVDVIGALLLADRAITALVPEEQIKAGMLPEGSPPTGIVLKRISRPLHVQPLSAGAMRRFRERVQVTVQAPNYELQDRLVDLVTSACSDRIGDIGGVTAVSVLYAGTGPDFMDEDATLFMGSVDFFVSFNTPA